MGTYYVATDGDPGNDGTELSPWDTVTTALSNVGGGHTIIMADGTYDGFYVNAGNDGTESNPTTIQAANKWGAVIRGAADVHAIWTPCDWVVFDGLKVRHGGIDGIKVNGDYCTIKNCWILQCERQGISSINNTGSTVDSCLVERNGSHLQFDHAIYLNGADCTVKNNIIRHNGGWGLHLYPELETSFVHNNLLHDNQRGQLLVYCPGGGGSNEIHHNTCFGRERVFYLQDGDGESVANNIFISETGTDPIAYVNVSNTLTDYNACNPSSTEQGGNGISDTISFVEVAKRVMWLPTGSPAIGAGSSTKTPPLDFWGRAYGLGDPDLGCFVYEADLADPAYRDSWYYGWPYDLAQAGYPIPDLWEAPP